MIDSRFLSITTSILCNSIFWRPLSLPFNESFDRGTSIVIEFDLTFMSIYNSIKL